MERPEKLSYRYIFLVLILLNAILRFAGLGSFSLSNDELSAVSRLDFEYMLDLIQYGVLETDPHPAGVQIFLYFWNYVFGNTPFIMRLPFVLSGLCGLVFLFFIFKRWFGEQQALYSLALFSLLEFSLIHGQLARPYAIGLLATSAFVFFWDRLVLQSRNNLINASGYVISGLLCLLTHYFAGMFAGIVGLVGWIFVFKRSSPLYYLILNGLIILSFIGHLPITLAQFDRPQLTSWIPPTESIFIWEHLVAVFNDSWLFATCFVGLCLVSFFFLFRLRKDRVVYVFICLIFGLLPILAGIIYGQLRESVLMDRVLFFSTPFLIVIAFAGIPDLKRSTFTIGLSVLTVVVLFSTLFGQHFLRHEYTENFKGIAEHLKTIDLDETTVAGNYNAWDYVKYYLGDEDFKYSTAKIGTPQDLASYMDVVRNSKSSQLSVSWACTYQPIEAVEYARRVFPTLRDSGVFYNSGYWLLSREPVSRDTLFQFKPFEQDSIHMISGDLEYLDIVRLDSEGLRNLQVVNVWLKMKSVNAKGMKMVWEFKDENGISNYWRSRDLEVFRIDEEQIEVMVSIKVQEERDGNSLMVYFWNPEKTSGQLTNLEVTSFADSNYPNLY